MILLLDNHDSFVHNLARYFRLAGEPTRVIRSDAIDVAGCRDLAPTAIVLSPGPKRPEEAGCCIDVVRELSASLPILGVCLGHQAIGQALGAEVVAVPPVHGRGSRICHDHSEWFAGCPSPMLVGRYHSLAVLRSSLPADLIVAASTEPSFTEPTNDGPRIDGPTHPGERRFAKGADSGGTRGAGGEQPGAFDASDSAIVMAIRHRCRPLVGFQFHPESVLTPLGQRLIDNFVRLARAWSPESSRDRGQRPGDSSSFSSSSLSASSDAIAAAVNRSVATASSSSTQPIP